MELAQILQLLREYNIVYYKDDKYTIQLGPIKTEFVENKKSIEKPIPGLPPEYSNPKLWPR